VQDQVFPVLVGGEIDVDFALEAANKGLIKILKPIRRSDDHHFTSAWRFTRAAVCVVRLFCFYYRSEED
jgi:hypothetical protein